MQEQHMRGKVIRIKKARLPHEKKAKLISMQIFLFVVGSEKLH